MAERGDTWEYALLGPFVKEDDVGVCAVGVGAPLLGCPYDSEPNCAYPF